MSAYVGRVVYVPLVVVVVCVKCVYLHGNGLVFCENEYHGRVLLLLLHYCGCKLYDAAMDHKKTHFNFILNPFVLHQLRPCHRHLLLPLIFTSSSSHLKNKRLHSFSPPYFGC